MLREPEEMEDWILDQMQCNLLDSVSIILYVGQCVSHSVFRSIKVTATKTSLSLSVSFM